MIVASGSYLYRLDGALQSIHEPWQLARHGDSLQLQGQRCVDGHVVLKVTADYRDGQCHQTQLHWQTKPTSPIRRFSYQKVGNQLNWQANGSTLNTLALPEKGLLFPLLRAATGILLPQLEAADGQLVLPNLRQEQDADFLKPLLSQRHCAVIEVHNGLQHLRYFGGEYGETGSDYWINEYDFVQRYSWQSAHGHWGVELDEFSCQPNFCW